MAKASPAAGPQAVGTVVGPEKLAIVSWRYARSFSPQILWQDASRSGRRLRPASQRN